MKNLLILTLFTFSLTVVFGQNYQTVKSVEQHYFWNLDNYILATKFDSNYVAGNDSVFLAFKTLRHSDTCFSMELTPRLDG